jgi:hypothetical protein
VSTLSSFFNRATGQKLSTVIGGAAFAQNQPAKAALTGGTLLLIAGAGVGLWYLSRKK